MKRLRTGVVLAAFGACSTRQPPPPAAPTASPPPGVAQPPPFQPAVSADSPEAIRRAILEEAFELVRDAYYDKTFGGRDWAAIRRKHEPLALAAPTEAAFYRELNAMIGELGQSHMEVTGPGDRDEDDPPPDGESATAAAGPPGEPGLTVRIVEDRPTVTRVRRGSSADRAGVRPGFVVTHIAGRPLTAAPRGIRPMRPAEERFWARLLATRRLAGPAGSKLTIRFLDLDDRPGEAMLEREPLRGRPVRIGLMPPLYPDLRVTQVGDVAVIAFNFFLFEPLLAEIQAAIDGLRARGAKALVIDLRGNPGGQGVMAVPIAAHLTREPLTLGTFHYRDFTQTLTAKPSIGVEPFLGPIAILTDEGSASTSEIFAAGMQESGRAIVVGDATPGYALPSAVRALPGGAVMQYVVADFQTPKGVLLEGRGVQPDRPVRETRAALRAGRDVALEAAVEAVKASRKR